MASHMADRCPKCGAKGFESGSAPCRACGWEHPVLGPWVPRGWYADPANPAQARWWEADAREWVGKARDDAAPVPIPTTPPPGWVPPPPPPPPIIENRDTMETAYRNCSADRLYAAAIRTVTEMGFAIVHSDSGAGTLSFHTGGSVMSRRGQQMTATVFEVDPAESKIVVGGKRLMGGFMSQFQIADLGELKILARTFLIRLTDVVAAMPEVETRPTSSAPTVDELERLACL
jgi:hypothetical protein